MKLPDTSKLAAIPLWTRDARGRVTLADGCQHGLLLDKAGSDQFLAHVHPEDQEKVALLIAAVRKGDCVSFPELEYRLRVDGHSYRWIIERNLPQRPGRLRADQYVSVAFDVTARKEAAAQLRESEQRFRDIAEVAADWIWEMDRDLRFRYLSPRFYELSGVRPKDIIGKRRDEFVKPDPSDEKWARHLDDLAHRRPIKAFRYAITSASGERKHFEIGGKPIFDAEGAFAGYRGTGTNRTGEARIRLALEQSERQFRNLVEGSLQGLYIHRHWRLLFVNQALADMLGYQSPEEVLELPSSIHLLHPDERARLKAYHSDRLSGREAPELYEARCLRKDGTVVWAEFRVRLVAWRGEQAVQTAIIDITERKKIEAALQRRNEELQTQNEQFNAALANMSQGLCMFDADSKLVVCNERYIDLYNLPRELSKPGTLFTDILEHRIAANVYDGDDPAAYIQERLAAVEEKKPSLKLQALSDGRVIAIAHRPMTNGGWVATHEDVTRLRRIEQQIVHMAHHDPLTDLPNRVLLRERIEQALARCRRGQGFAMHCLDLDHFKTVNDTLGHPCGDELLKAVAERLRSCIHAGDTLARLGGDEFAIVQLSNAKPADAAALARRIGEAVRAPFHFQGHHVVLDTSIGIAVAPQDGRDAEQLLKNADLALYRAKQEGRGIHRFFEREMDAQMQARRQLETELRTALIEDAFELYYQPLVDVTSREPAAYEALLRWHHPERGEIAPGDFIAVAEETGLIVELGEWVIRRACQDAVRFPAHIKISVNLSPAQFRSERLVQTIVSALVDARLPAIRLELEITETVLLQNTEATLAILDQLRDIGICIAMDDYGTGYSSLSYLRKFPFDKLKLDRSFVADLGHRSDAEAIVSAVAGLGRSLGMRTTAEGIETEEQFALIRAAGYTEAQGFLFGRPSPLREIADATEMAPIVLEGSG